MASLIPLRLTSKVRKSTNERSTVNSPFKKGVSGNISRKSMLTNSKKSKSLNQNALFGSTTIVEKDISIKSVINSDVDLNKNDEKNDVFNESTTVTSSTPFNVTIHDGGGEAMSSLTGLSLLDDTKMVADLDYSRSRTLCSSSGTINQSCFNKCRINYDKKYAQREGSCDTQLISKSCRTPRGNIIRHSVHAGAQRKTPQISKLANKFYKSPMWVSDKSKSSIIHDKKIKNSSSIASTSNNNLLSPLMVPNVTGNDVEMKDNLNDKFTSFDVNNSLFPTLSPNKDEKIPETSTSCFEQVGGDNHSTLTSSVRKETDFPLDISSTYSVPKTPRNSFVRHTILVNSRRTLPTPPKVMHVLRKSNSKLTEYEKIAIMFGKKVKDISKRNTATTSNGNLLSPSMMSSVADDNVETKDDLSDKFTSFDVNNSLFPTLSPNKDEKIPETSTPCFKQVGEDNHSALPSSVRKETGSPLEISTTHSVPKTPRNSFVRHTILVNSRRTLPTPPRVMHVIRNSNSRLTESEKIAIMFGKKIKTLPQRNIATTSNSMSVVSSVTDDNVEITDDLNNECGINNSNTLISFQNGDEKIQEISALCFKNPSADNYSTLTSKIGNEMDSVLEISTAHSPLKTPRNQVVNHTILDNSQRTLPKSQKVVHATRNSNSRLTENEKIATMFGKKVKDLPKRNIATTSNGNVYSPSMMSNVADDNVEIKDDLNDKLTSSDINNSDISISFPNEDEKIPTTSTPCLKQVCRDDYCALTSSMGNGTDSVLNISTTHSVPKTPRNSFVRHTILVNSRRTLPTPPKVMHVIRNSYSSLTENEKIAIMFGKKVKDLPKRNIVNTSNNILSQSVISGVTDDNVEIKDDMSVNSVSWDKKNHKPECNVSKIIPRKKRELVKPAAWKRNLVKMKPYKSSILNNSSGLENDDFGAMCQSPSEISLDMPDVTPYSPSDTIHTFPDSAVKDYLDDSIRTSSMIVSKLLDDATINTITTPFSDSKTRRGISCIENTALLNEEECTLPEASMLVNIDSRECSLGSFSNDDCTPQTNANVSNGESSSPADTLRFINCRKRRKISSNSTVGVSNLNLSEITDHNQILSNQTPVTSQLVTRRNTVSSSKMELSPTNLVENFTARKSILKSRNVRNSVVSSKKKLPLKTVSFAISRLSEETSILDGIEPLDATMNSVNFGRSFSLKNRPCATDQSVRSSSSIDNLIADDNKYESDLTSNSLIVRDNRISHLEESTNVDESYIKKRVGQSDESTNDLCELNNESTKRFNESKSRNESDMINNSNLINDSESFKAGDKLIDFSRIADKKNSSIDTSFNSSIKLQDEVKDEKSNRYRTTSTPKISRIVSDSYIDAELKPLEKCSIGNLSALNCIKENYLKSEYSTDRADIVTNASIVIGNIDSVQTRIDAFDKTDVTSFVDNTVISNVADSRYMSNLIADEEGNFTTDIIKTTRTIVKSDILDCSNPEYGEHITSTSFIGNEENASSAESDVFSERKLHSHNAKCVLVVNSSNIKDEGTCCLPDKITNDTKEIQPDIIVDSLKKRHNESLINFDDSDRVSIIKREQTNIEINEGDLQIISENNLPIRERKSFNYTIDERAYSEDNLSYIEGTGGVDAIKQVNRVYVNPSAEIRSQLSNVEIKLFENEVRPMEQTKRSSKNNSRDGIFYSVESENVFNETNFSNTNRSNRSGLGENCFTGTTRSSGTFEPDRNNTFEIDNLELDVSKKQNEANSIIIRKTNESEVGKLSMNSFKNENIDKIDDISNTEFEPDKNNTFEIVNLELDVSKLQNETNSNTIRKTNESEVSKLSMNSFKNENIDKIDDIFNTEFEPDKNNTFEIVNLELDVSKLQNETNSNTIRKTNESKVSKLSMNSFKNENIDKIDDISNTEFEPDKNNTFEIVNLELDVSKLKNETNSNTIRKTNESKVSKLSMNSFKNENIDKIDDISNTEFEPDKNNTFEIVNLELDVSKLQNETNSNTIRKTNESKVSKLSMNSFKNENIDKIDDISNTEFEPDKNNTFEIVNLELDVSKLQNETNSNTIRKTNESKVSKLSMNSFKNENIDKIDDISNTEFESDKNNTFEIVNLELDVSKLQNETNSNTIRKFNESEVSKLSMNSFKNENIDKIDDISNTEFEPDKNNTFEIVNLELDVSKLQNETNSNTIRKFNESKVSKLSMNSFKNENIDKIDDISNTEFEPDKNNTFEIVNLELDVSKLQNETNSNTIRKTNESKVSKLSMNSFKNENIDKIDDISNREFEPDKNNTFEIVNLELDVSKLQNETNSNNRKTNDSEEVDKLSMNSFKNQVSNIDKIDDISSNAEFEPDKNNTLGIENSEHDFKVDKLRNETNLYNQETDESKVEMFNVNSSKIEMPNINEITNITVNGALEDNNKMINDEDKVESNVDTNNRKTTDDRENRVYINNSENSSFLINEKTDYVSFMNDVEENKNTTRDVVVDMLEVSGDGKFNTDNETIHDNDNETIHDNATSSVSHYAESNRNYEMESEISGKDKLLGRNSLININKTDEERLQTVISAETDAIKQGQYGGTSSLDAEFRPNQMNTDEISNLYPIQNEIVDGQHHVMEIIIDPNKVDYFASNEENSEFYRLENATFARRNNFDNTNSNNSNTCNLRLTINQDVASPGFISANLNSSIKTLRENLILSNVDNVISNSFKVVRTNNLEVGSSSDIGSEELFATTSEEASSNDTNTNDDDNWCVILNDTTLVGITNIRDVLKIKETASDYRNVDGVKRLFERPITSSSPFSSYNDVEGVKSIVDRKSPRNDYSDVAGVKRLFQNYNPESNYSLSNTSGVERLFRNFSPNKDELFAKENDANETRTKRAKITACSSGSNNECSTDAIGRRLLRNRRQINVRMDPVNVNTAVEMNQPKLSTKVKRTRVATSEIAGKSSTRRGKMNDNHPYENSFNSNHHRVNREPVSIVDNAELSKNKSKIKRKIDDEYIIDDRKILSNNISNYARLALEESNIETRTRSRTNVNKSSQVQLYQVDDSNVVRTRSKRKICDVLKDEVTTSRNTERKTSRRKNDRDAAEKTYTLRSIAVVDDTDVSNNDENNELSRNKKLTSIYIKDDGDNNNRNKTKGNRGKNNDDKHAANRKYTAENHHPSDTGLPTINTKSVNNAVNGVLVRRSPLEKQRKTVSFQKNINNGKNQVKRTPIRTRSRAAKVNDDNDDGAMTAITNDKKVDKYKRDSESVVVSDVNKSIHSDSNDIVQQAEPSLTVGHKHAVSSGNNRSKKKLVSVKNVEEPLTVKMDNSKKKNQIDRRRNNEEQASTTVANDNDDKVTVTEERERINEPTAPATIGENCYHLRKRPGRT